MPSSGFGRSLVLGAIVLCAAAEAPAQTTPAIDHEAEPCWLANEFPRLTAGIEPGAEVQTAKVYFRSDKFTDFYYVEMKMSALASFLAVLPKPGPETERVIYYVEAVDSSFNSARTAEFDPAIEDPCKRRSPAAIFTGADPGIIVGATKAGVAAIPPGFQAAGIAGFITAAGVTTGVGGGVGLGTAAVVAGVGAAAAGGIVVASSGQGSSTTTAPPAASPSTTSSVAVTSSTTTTSPTTTSTGAATTSSTTSAPSGTSSVAPTTTTTSAPSTTTSSAATTTIPSTTTTSISSTTSSSTTTTSIPSTTTTTVAAPPVTACFTMTKLNSCVWRFNASCSTGPIVQYDWLIDPAGNMPAPRPPVSYSGQVVTVDWNPPFGGCSGSPFITAQLTVVGSAGQTDSKSQGVNIDLKPLRERGGIETAFTSLAETGARGFVTLNRARTDTTSGSTPFHHVLHGLWGKNAIEAYTEPAGSEGLWKFDFSSSAAFIPGSLRVESGTVAVLDARTIVFRLIGDSGERIRFSFELSQN